MRRGKLVHVESGPVYDFLELVLKPLRAHLRVKLLAPVTTETIVRRITEDFPKASWADSNDARYVVQAASYSLGSISSFWLCADQFPRTGSRRSPAERWQNHGGPPRSFSQKRSTQPAASTTPRR